MSAKVRALAPLAIVVAASLLALVLKGVTEWITDLLVSACGCLAGRLKGVHAPEGERADPAARHRHALRQKIRRSWRHANAVVEPTGGAPRALAWEFAEEVG